MKKIILLICFLIISFSSFAKNKWSDSVQRLLPPPLESITVKKTKMSEVQKLLGKPALVEGPNHYYAQGQFKYSLQIVYQKNTVSEISYTFLAPRPAMDFEKLKIDSKKLMPLPHESQGKLLKYSDEEGELIIDAVAKTLYSVRLK